MQKFVGARRRYAQRAGDKLRVEKQRQLIKIFDARCVQSLFYLQLILEIPEKKLAFRRSLCQGASGSRRRVQRRGIFVLGKTFSRRNTFRISRKNDVAQREKARCLARWRLSDTPQAKHSCSPCFPKRGAPSDCCSSRAAFFIFDCHPPYPFLPCGLLLTHTALASPWYAGCSCNVAAYFSGEYRLWRWV